jgi:hypothetical protein
MTRVLLLLVTAVVVPRSWSGSRGKALTSFRDLVSCHGVTGYVFVNATEPSGWTASILAVLVPNENRS